MGKKRGHAAGVTINTTAARATAEETRRIIGLIPFSVSGQVCGIDNVEPGLSRPFRWDFQTNEIIDIGSLPGCQDFDGFAAAINDLGHVTGYEWGGPVDCNAEAWFWTPENGLLAIGALPGNVVPSSEGRAINNLNQIVGASLGPLGQEAFLWDPVTGMIGLGNLGGASFASIAEDINDNTWVVGSATSSRGSEAFLWTPQDGMIGLGDFYNDGFAYSDATAINQLGHIVGGADHPHAVQAFLWTPEDGMIGLGWLDPDAAHQGSGAYDLNDRGEVIGSSSWGNDYGYRSFIWDAVRGMREIGALIDPCLTRQWPYSYDGAIAINNAGQILLGRGPSRYAVVLTPYLPGDLDENQICDLQDLAIQLSNFSRAGDAEYQHGDLDCDQDVDLQDLAILLANFGESLP